MKRKIIPAVIFLLAVPILPSSCMEEKKNTDGSSISTDIVNNPLSASESNGDGLPLMTFTAESHDFGTIMEGEKVSHLFHFTNTGKTDLLITSASSSCGCTVPEYPKKPITPGEQGTIKVVFDSEGKNGKFEKTVTLLTNAIPNTKTLKIKGNVFASEDKKEKK